MNRDLSEYYEDMEVSGGKIEPLLLASSMRKVVKNKTRSKQNKTFRTTQRKRDNKIK